MQPVVVFLIFFRNISWNYPIFNALKKQYNNLSDMLKTISKAVFSFESRNWFFKNTLIISSSSCRTISTDISDSLSPHLPIVYHFRRVLRATSCIYTELLYVGLSGSPCLCSAMWRGPQEYITYELVPTSPAVSFMSGLSNFDSFRDGW